MLYWSLIFLVMALVVGVLGLTGVAAIAAEIAWALFVVGLVLAVATGDDITLVAKDGTATKATIHHGCW